MIALPRAAAETSVSTAATANRGVERTRWLLHPQKFGMPDVNKREAHLRQVHVAERVKKLPNSQKVLYVFYSFCVFCTYITSEAPLIGSAAGRLGDKSQNSLWKRLLQTCRSRDLRPKFRATAATCPCERALKLPGAATAAIDSVLTVTARVRVSLLSQYCFHVRHSRHQIKTSGIGLAPSELYN